ncbi:DEAD (Asp-Glu-Ala-Asp) box polypeptide 59 [Lunasporangiospora selenospora]|uniref:RNA helicase n=1 Tax=Lunasporangiospora selenospora TaxID=979761 RepID=A0A9P6G4S2_9FUNG|nr:DEAD (Asp-Glu-Ala-Asp) box polypeptide 59 [Lunasporangiospora selenospora]
MLLNDPMFVPRSVSRQKGIARANLPTLANVRAASSAQILSVPTHPRSPWDHGQMQLVESQQTNISTIPTLSTRAISETWIAGSSTIPQNQSQDTFLLDSDQHNAQGTETAAGTQMAEGSSERPPPLSKPSYYNTRMICSITGYTKSPRMLTMTTKEAADLRARHHIQVQGKHVPPPIESFDECKLPPKLHLNLLENGYSQPTPVQTQAIPAGLLGRDMLISAATGAGKTASFLIPVLSHVYGLSQVYCKSTLPSTEATQGPFAIIFVPTRELAMQIESNIKQMVRGMPNMLTALLVGGQAMVNQVYRLKQNIQVAIATPGRLVDIMAKHPEISFSNVFCLVLDEVDMMFSMGFGKQVKRLLDTLPEPPNGRQALMCSATIPRQVQKMAMQYLVDPLQIRIYDPSIITNMDPPSTPSKTAHTKHEDVFSPSSRIKQTILWVENKSKKNQLFSLLRDKNYFRPPVLIFVDSRVGADLLAKAIQLKCPEITAASIHGEKHQDERTSVINSIADGTTSVVVATGLLARGLNLQVATVINFDMAPTIQDYVHRVGRANPDIATKASTGLRKGPKLGGMSWAITFINEDHMSLLSEFANMLHGLGIERVTPLPQQLKRLVIEKPVGKKAIGSNRQTSSQNPGSKATSQMQAKPTLLLPPKRRLDGEGSKGNRNKQRRL